MPSHDDDHRSIAMLIGLCIISALMFAIAALVIYAMMHTSFTGERIPNENHSSIEREIQREHTNTRERDNNRLSTPFST